MMAKSFFFVLSFLLHYALSLDILTLSSIETLVSPNKKFELGFFKLKSHWYVGIWYKEDPDRTSLWVANRDIPLLGSEGTLTLFEGNLFLFNGSHFPLWKANLTRGVVKSEMVAQLLDNGNFVVKDSTGNLWQSFDYPTDTLLPGMKFDKPLYSWSRQDDPSTGIIWFEIRQYQFTFSTYMANHRNDIWNGFQFGDIPPIFQLKDSFFVMKIPQDMKSSYYRLKLEVEGVYNLYTWDSENMKWLLSWSMDNCTLIATDDQSCGGYSYCSARDMSHMCLCIEGFSPKMEFNHLIGCVRENDVNCTVPRINFIKLQNMKFPDMSIMYESDAENCKKGCLHECICTAFAVFKNQKGQSICAIWKKELHGFRNYTFGGQDIYIKLAGKDLATSPQNDSNNRTLTVSLIVALSIVGGAVFIYLSWRWYKKSRTIAREPTRAEVIMEELAGFPDRFEVMSLRTVREATNDFDDANILGQGGFGIVYKGTSRDGRDMAVKRLQGISSEGLSEFRNEVNLILRVLHVNLVRLQGCCWEGDEKILIYEYLENHSLDYYLFDQAYSALLNWGKRFGIVKGVAEGLSYLHNFTTPPILHRDLKPSNILLGRDRIPKISDFGLARMLENGIVETQTTKVVGTRGYMSEEYALHSLMSEKSDVFSFGVTVLEILTGERNIEYCSTNQGDSLLDKVWRHWNEGNGLHLVDSSFIDPSFVEGEILRCMHVALLCVQEHVDDGPSTRSVVLMLESIEVGIPTPRRPNYYYGRVLHNETAASSSTSTTMMTHSAFLGVQPR